MNEKHERRSTLGRPRIVTDVQIQEILTWAANRQTMKEKAHQLGLSPSVLAYVIRTHGQGYKQASPEQRATNLRQVHDHRAQLRREYWL